MARTKKAPLRAIVDVYGSREGTSTFNHATVSLYRGEGNPAWLQIRFQRHSLAIRDHLTETDSRGWRTLPNPQFDFGHAWSSFYSPRIATDFACEYSGPDHMRSAAAFVARVNGAIRKFNLGYTTECDLTRWVEAFACLKIPVEMHRSLSGIPDLSLREVPEDQRAPSRKLIEAEGARNSA